MDKINTLKNNCSEHKKDIAGISDMKVLTEMIGNLHYETLSELLDMLADKIYFDSAKDRACGRNELAHLLENCAEHISAAQIWMKEAWQISKPFINDKNK